MNAEAGARCLRPLYGRHSLGGVAPTPCRLAAPSIVKGLAARGKYVAMRIGIERTTGCFARRAGPFTGRCFRSRPTTCLPERSRSAARRVGRYPQLIDVLWTRPVTASTRREREAAVAESPAQSLVSHLGFEPPRGAFRRSGTAAGRLLLRVVLEA